MNKNKVKVMSTGRRDWSAIAYSENGKLRIRDMIVPGDAHVISSINTVQQSKRLSPSLLLRDMPVQFAEGFDPYVNTGMEDFSNLITITKLGNIERCFALGAMESLDLSKITPILLKPLDSTCSPTRNSTSTPPPSRELRLRLMSEPRFEV
jgi:hypothetical protein